MKKRKLHLNRKKPDYNKRTERVRRYLRMALSHSKWVDLSNKMPDMTWMLDCIDWDMSDEELKETEILVGYLYYSIDDFFSNCAYREYLYQQQRDVFFKLIKLMNHLSKYRKQ